MKQPKAPLSASELSAGYGCIRKWSAQYLDNDWPREEVSPAKFATGTAVHKLCEVYAETGFVPRDPHPVIDMFLNAMQYLPLPKTHWEIEHRETATVQGLPFELTPDWYGPSDALPSSKERGDTLQIPAGLPALADFKTSGTQDLKRYGLFGDAKKLADMQSVLYSHVKAKGSPIVFRHLYIRKTGQVLALEALETSDPIERAKIEAKARRMPLSQKCRPADSILQPRDVQDAMDRMLLPLGEALYRIRSRGVKINPLDFPPNAGHCDDQYGGCPHTGRCNLTPAEALASLSGDHMQNLFAQLPPINGPTNGAPTPPAATPFSAPPLQGGFSFGAPATPTPPPPPPAPPEELPPGYSLCENPAFLKSPNGMYEPRDQVLAAYAAYKATAEVVPSSTPAVVVEQAIAKATDAQLGAAVRALLELYSR